MFSRQYTEGCLCSSRIKNDIKEERYDEIR